MEVVLSAVTVLPTLELNSGNLPRLTFPSLQQTASPLSILPGFLEVLGRKIDNTVDVIETWLVYSCSKISPIVCLADKDKLSKIGGTRAQT